MDKKKNRKMRSLLQFAGFGFPALFVWMTVIIVPFIYGIWITFTDWKITLQYLRIRLLCHHF